MQVRPGAYNPYSRSDIAHSVFGPRPPATQSTQGGNHGKAHGVGRRGQLIQADTIKINIQSTISLRRDFTCQTVLAVQVEFKSARSTKCTRSLRTFTRIELRTRLTAAISAFCQGGARYFTTQPYQPKRLNAEIALANSSNGLYIGYFKCMGYEGPNKF